LQLPVWIAAGLLFVQDVRGKVMLGDAGANYLGFAAGVALIEGTPLGLQIIMALLLISLHIVAERISLSAWIEAKPLLRWLDGLGRDTRMVK
jgi:UDP-N-acetylmuramyl pentapeptide phosphotransferase/UDP-N-acetylglucosamine-1-phosphate transferase